MPGPWFRTKFEPTLQDQWQYADMPNGAYYSMTQVTTYAAFRHLTAAEIRRKTDSLLYENVPGKILQKTFLDNRVFPGLEVISRNRRGDMQRLQVFFTPFEAIFLKVSGPVNYMQGPGPDCFFPLFNFTLNLVNCFRSLMPAHLLPPCRVGSAKKCKSPLLPSRREYLSVDSTTGHAYLLLRSDVHQFGLLGEDSIDLRLMEASFFEPGASGRVVARQWTKLQGYPGLYVREVMGDSSLRETSFVIKGPQYYVWSVRHPIGEISHEPMPVGVFLSVANAQPQAGIYGRYRSSIPAKFVRSHPSIRNCGASVQKCLNYRLTCFSRPDPPVIGLCRVPVFCAISQPESWPCCNGRPFRNIIKSAIPLFLAAGNTNPEQGC